MKGMIMFEKALKAGAFAAVLALPGLALGQAAPADAKPAEEASPHTFTANVGVYSQYIFRGLSQTNGNKAFAVLDAQGTYYLDLSAAYPVGDTGLTLIGHYGRQKYDGTDARTAALGSNDSIYSYNDYKLGASYDLGKLTKVLNAVTVGAYYTNTSSANGLGYNGRGDAPAGPYPKAISGSNGTVYLQK